MNIDISKLVDQRNEALWNEANLKYQVKLLPSTDMTYGVFTQGKNVVIYVPLSNHCLDSFTHELLHLSIRMKEVYVGSNLKNTIASSSILTWLFTEDHVNKEMS